MTGGLDVRTRVTRRSQEDKQEARRIETSEYMEQVGVGGGACRRGWSLSTRQPGRPPASLQCSRPDGAARAEGSLPAPAPPPSQIFDSGGGTRVKASQCFTKYPTPKIVPHPLTPLEPPTPRSSTPGAGRASRRRSASQSTSSATRPSPSARAAPRSSPRRRAGSLCRSVRAGGGAGRGLGGAAPACPSPWLTWPGPLSCLSPPPPGGVRLPDPIRRGGRLPGSPQQPCGGVHVSDGLHAPPLQRRRVRGDRGVVSAAPPAPGGRRRADPACGGALHSGPPQRSAASSTPCRPG
jgi:hypothetical protein